MEKVMAILSIAVVIALCVNISLYFRHQNVMQKLVDINAGITETQQVIIETEAAYNERMAEIVQAASSSTTSRPSNTELLTPDNYDPSKFSRNIEDYDLTIWTESDMIGNRIICNTTEGKEKMYKMEDWLTTMENVDEDWWIGTAARGCMLTPNGYADARKAIEAIAKQSEAIAKETDAQHAARIQAEYDAWVAAGGLDALKAELDAKIARGE